MRIFVLVVGLLNLLLSGSALFLGSAAMAGSIVSWGREVYGQVSNTPTGTGYTAIAGGSQHSLALAVPKPGVEASLLAGALGLAWLQRRREGALAKAAQRPAPPQPPGDARRAQRSRRPRARSASRSC